METLQNWPPLLYGTAWKRERTAEFVDLAISHGYRGIDTAGQPVHYNETDVGAGVAEARQSLGLAREELFLQTKFSPLNAQGDDVPYDVKAAPAEQVEQSLQSSLANFGTDYLDSVLLHAPQNPRGLDDLDLAYWEALESARERGLARRIGVSNFSLRHLEELVSQARTLPAAVQNRCFASDGWDRDVRTFCKEKGIVYQGFSLLTANPQVLKNQTLHDCANRLKATPAQTVFAFARSVGMLPLTGTTDTKHMDEDRAAVEIELDRETAILIERLAQ